MSGTVDIPPTVVTDGQSRTIDAMVWIRDNLSDAVQTLSEKVAELGQMVSSTPVSSAAGLSMGFLVLMALTAIASLLHRWWLGEQYRTWKEEFCRCLFDMIFSPCCLPWHLIFLAKACYTGPKKRREEEEGDNNKSKLK